MPPQGADALEQNALAGLGRGGAQKLRRGEAQLAAHGEPRGPHRAEQRRAQRQRAHAPVKHQFDLGKAVHEAVRHPDDPGEDRGAEEKADDAADGGRAAGIEDELAHDGARGIAHGLEHADLRALLVDHARHRRHAHQRRHHEEEQGEDHGDALDDLRIALEAGVADVGGTVEHVDVRLVDLGDLFPRVGDLASGVGQFALGLHEFAVGLRAAVLVFLDAVGQLRLGVLQFGTAVDELLFAVLNLGERVAQFGAAAADLAAGGGKLAVGLLAAGLYLVKAGLELRQRRLHLPVAVYVTALFNGGEPCLRLRKLLLQGGKLPLDLGERRVVGGLILGKLLLQRIPLRLRGGDLVVKVRGSRSDLRHDALQRRALLRQRCLDLGAAVGVGRRRERGKLRFSGGDVPVYGGQLLVEVAKRRVALVLQRGKTALGLRELLRQRVVFALRRGNAAFVITLHAGDLAVQFSLAAFQGSDLPLQGGDALGVGLGVEGGELAPLGGDVALHLRKLALQRGEGVVAFRREGGNIALRRRRLRGKAVARRLRFADARLIVRGCGIERALHAIALRTQIGKLGVQFGDARVVAGLQGGELGFQGGDLLLQRRAPALQLSQRFFLLAAQYGNGLFCRGQAVAQLFASGVQFIARRLRLRNAALQLGDALGQLRVLFEHAAFLDLRHAVLHGSELRLQLRLRFIELGVGALLGALQLALGAV